MAAHGTTWSRTPLSRRSFLKGTAAGAAALTAAGSGAFASRAQASDWSGETLRFMIINPHAGSIKPLSEGFTELTGANVEAVKVPYDQITAQSTLDVMSGTNEIDVFQYWYVDKEALVRDGVLADITDRISAEEAEIDPADFLGSLYDAYTEVDGLRYGLPYDGDTHVLFYNKEILDRNGLTPPATWDEYNAVAKAVTEAESANGVYGALLMCKQFPIILCSTYANRLGGYGGDFLDASGAPALTSDAAIGAARTMLEAGPSAVPTPLETEFGNSIPVFLSGGAAMIEFWTDLGTWAQDANQSQIVDKWGVSPMPVAGGNTVNRPAMNAGWAFGVSSGSHNPEMAWEFVRMSSSKDFHVRVLTDNTTGVDPTRRSAMPAYREFAPLQADAVEQAIDDAFPWPMKPESPKLMQSLTDELGLMMAGDKTVEQAMGDAQASWEDILG
ncbi:MAG: sugar ABC transporter substrate-binding protein [Rhodospirillaceae bacterium]|nr:sugar ABC transporter substrate-binding protein [Rhodospirillaceae bacterium]